MAQKISALLFQILESAEPKLSPLEIQLSSHYASNFFALDNHSDPLSFQFAAQFIEEAEFALVIIWQEGNESTKGLQSIMNGLLKKRHSSTILTNFSHPWIKKLSKSMPVKSVSTISELLETLKSY